MFDLCDWHQRPRHTDELTKEEEEWQHGGLRCESALNDWLSFFSSVLAFSSQMSPHTNSASCWLSSMFVLVREHSTFSKDLQGRLPPELRWLLTRCSVCCLMYLLSRRFTLLPDCKRLKESVHVVETCGLSSLCRLQLAFRSIKALLAISQYQDQKHHKRPFYNYWNIPYLFGL